MKSIRILIALAVLGSNGACLNTTDVSSGSGHRTVIGGSSTDIEYHTKERAILNASLPQAQELRVVRSVRSQLGGNGPFVYPVALTLSDNGQVYLTDNNAHLIRYCSTESGAIATLPPQQGTGKLVWPNLVERLGSSLFVTDNEGIKI